MNKECKDKKFIVYEHLFPNGKRYFGITSKEPNQRWENGSGYTKDKQSVVYNAIQKYGWDNIEHNVLFKDLSFEEATNMEKYLINKYKTNCRRYGNSYGYNMTDGGEGSLGHKVSDEGLKKMSEARLGKRGKDCPTSKVVVCDGVEYESLELFKEHFNYPKGNINGWLSGRVAMPKEWYDRKLHYKDVGFDVVKCQQNPHANKIAIDGKTFNSQSELANYLNISPATVCCWLSGKHRVPNNILDRGFKYIDKDTIDLISTEKGHKTKVEYDGIIFDSQAELARFLNIHKATLNSWLVGKNKMPQNMIEKGLKYIK